MATQEFSDSCSNKEKRSRFLAAESTYWHQLRYKKSQMELSAGIEECDRASIPVSQ